MSRREVGENRIMRSRSEYGDADNALFLFALFKLARRLGDPSREAGKKRVYFYSAHIYVNVVNRIVEEGKTMERHVGPHPNIPGH